MADRPTVAHRRPAVSGDGRMTEAAFLSALTTGTRTRPGLCALLGIAWYHPHDSRRSPGGWPDLALVGARGFLLRELKTATGRVTAAQGEWGRRLLAAGADWAVWRPADLASGRIVAELEAIR